MKVQEDDPEPKQPRKRRKPRRARERDWGDCEVCGQNLPIVPETGMCGPCTFGEASTLLGDW